MRFPFVSTLSEHGQPLAGFRTPRPRSWSARPPSLPRPREKRRIFRLPLLRGHAGTRAASRKERVEQKERERGAAVRRGGRKSLFQDAGGKGTTRRTSGASPLSVRTRDRRAQPDDHSRPKLGRPGSGDHRSGRHPQRGDGRGLEARHRQVHSLRAAQPRCRLRGYLFKRSQKRRLPINNPGRPPALPTERGSPSSGMVVGTCQWRGAIRASASCGPHDPGS